MAPLSWAARHLAAAAFIAILAGCAAPSPGPGLPSILPDGTAPAFVQHGIASWYGPRFHGRRTASGERFDQHAMTAAHRTLPLGAVATVRNLENGRWVRVRINDRGPFKPNRVIDLSRAAARHLDIVEDGLARVSVEAHAGDWDPDGPRPVRDPG